MKTTHLTASHERLFKFADLNINCVRDNSCGVSLSTLCAHLSDKLAKPKNNNYKFIKQEGDYQYCYTINNSGTRLSDIVTNKWYTYATNVVIRRNEQTYFEIII